MAAVTCSGGGSGGPGGLLCRDPRRGRRGFYPRRPLPAARPRRSHGHPRRPPERPSGTALGWHECNASTPCTRAHAVSSRAPRPARRASRAASTVRRTGIRSSRCHSAPALPPAACDPWAGVLCYACCRAQHSTPAVIGMSSSLPLWQGPWPLVHGQEATHAVTVCVCFAWEAQSLNFRMNTGSVSTEHQRRTKFAVLALRST